MKQILSIYYRQGDDYEPADAGMRRYASEGAINRIEVSHVHELIYTYSLYSNLAAEDI